MCNDLGCSFGSSDPTTIPISAMLRTFGSFLRGAQPVTTTAAFHRRPRGVSYCCAATDGMTGPKAKVGQPAPHWRGKAVLNDEIKDISLDDFKAR